MVKPYFIRWSGVDVSVAVGAWWRRCCGLCVAQPRRLAKPVFLTLRENFRSPPSASAATRRAPRQIYGGSGWRFIEAQTPVRRARLLTVLSLVHAPRPTTHISPVSSSPEPGVATPLPVSYRPPFPVLRSHIIAALPPALPYPVVKSRCVRTCARVES